jgi:hypothetical protein|tara:strand:+ start:32 stop:592 length:561 start_codon:yes stop_codon:yes gene_type:complete
MKKIFLSILITLATINTVNADAICKDGWKSTSEGSGTCSWHGGVCSWKPNYTYRSTSNTFNSDHNHGYDNCYSDSGSGGGVSDQAIIAAGVAALIFYDASQVKSINLNQYKSTQSWSKTDFLNFLASVNQYYSSTDRKDIFDTFDLNKDKRISVKEARVADKNQNGTLTTTELEWFRTKYFKGTMF